MMGSLAKEIVPVNIEDELKEKEKELDDYRRSPVKNIWKNELDEFLKAYKTWLKDLQAEELGDSLG